MEVETAVGDVAVQATPVLVCARASHRLYVTLSSVLVVDMNALMPVQETAVLLACRPMHGATVLCSPNQGNAHEHGILRSNPKVLNRFFVKAVRAAF